MSVSINGSTGISGIDGSASTPALQGSDTNTGLSFGTDVVAINTGGTEALRVDASRRLLVGTSTALSGSVNPNFNSGNALLQVVGNSSGTPRGATVALGRSQAASAIIANDFIGGLIFNDNASAEFAHIFCYADAAAGTGDHPSRLVFSTTADGASSPTERMRISKDGHTSIRSVIGGCVAFLVSGTANSSDTLVSGFHSSTDISSGTASIRIRTNGNIENTYNSYGQLSDIKLKENIASASSQWDDIKALEVVNFNFIDDQTRQIGLIAQQVEAVSPGLVSDATDLDEDGNDLGTVTKSVKYSVLYMKAVKALQEAMERIETLEAQNASLETQNASFEARLAALEGGN